MINALILKIHENKKLRKTLDFFGFFFGGGGEPASKKPAFQPHCASKEYGEVGVCVYVFPHSRIQLNISVTSSLSFATTCKRGPFR